MKREEGSEGWPLSGCLGEVCRPQAMGGVGISSFPELCWALIMRWLWLEKTNPTKPWIDLPIQVPKKGIRAIPNLSDKNNRKEGSGLTNFCLMRLDKLFCCSYH